MEAENSPVVLLVEEGEREVRGEGGESEKERKMKQEMEGRREVQELLVLEKSQGVALVRKKERQD